MIIDRIFVIIFAFFTEATCFQPIPLCCILIHKRIVYISLSSDKLSRFSLNFLTQLGFCLTVHRDPLTVARVFDLFSI